MDRTPEPESEHVDTVVIGGGQAGLSTGYHLRARDEPFVILDANERVGDAWRTRWDSLRLFTPARYDGLEGLPFPGSKLSFPSKDEMADYLEAYAERFDLPVRTGLHVDRLSRHGDRYTIDAGPRRFSADSVVVATGANQVPRRPTFAADLDPSVVQMHSYEYRDPSQLRDGGVLVVGVGNSGAEIAFELVRSHETWLSGEPSAEIPFRHGPAAARFAFPVIRFMGHHVLTQGTPIGRRLGPKLEAGAAPLIRVKTKDLAEAGVRRVPRTAGVRDGLPLLEDGQALAVTNVIWCTGFRYDFGWIDLPVVDSDGAPAHRRGIATGQQGLYFMGLVFQYAVSSDVLPGMSRDAEFIAKAIADRRSG